MWSCKKYSEELLINGFSFLTESGRILEAGGGGGLLKEVYLRGGLIWKGRGLNRIITVFVLYDQSFFDQTIAIQGNFCDAKFTNLEISISYPVSI